MQTTILSILNVVIMMRMTIASFKQFYENVDKSIKKHLSSWRKESVPRQRIRKWCHGNISVPVAHGDTGAKGDVRMCGTCDRRWGDPGYRVPTRWWHGKRGTCKDNSKTVQNSGITYNKHSFSEGRLGGYTF